MDTEKYSRVSLVLDTRTNRALRYIAAFTERSVSEVARELLGEPAAAVADSLGDLQVIGKDGDVKAVLDQLDMFVEGAYGRYLKERSKVHG